MNPSLFARALEAASTLPSSGFLRQHQVLQFVPISKSTLWRQVRALTFPQPEKLSERITAWRAEDLRRWIQQQRPAPVESKAGRDRGALPDRARQPPPLRSPRCRQRGKRR